MSINVSRVKSKWVRRPLIVLSFPFLALAIVAWVTVCALVGAVVMTCIVPFNFIAQLLPVGARSLQYLGRTAKAVW